jgi:hypothetical protein
MMGNYGSMDGLFGWMGGTWLLVLLLLILGIIASVKYLRD